MGSETLVLVDQRALEKQEKYKYQQNGLYKKRNSNTQNKLE